MMTTYSTIADSPSPSPSLPSLSPPAKSPLKTMVFNEFTHSPSLPLSPPQPVNSPYPPPPPPLLLLLLLLPIPAALWLLPSSSCWMPLRSRHRLMRSTLKLNTRKQQTCTRSALVRGSVFDMGEGTVFHLPSLFHPFF